MATSLGTLTSGSPTGSGVAWAGGNGEFSCEGDLRDPTNLGEPAVLILEDDTSGQFKPLGDVFLNHDDDRVGFFAGACNLRIRLKGADSSSSVEGFVA